MSTKKMTLKKIIITSLTLQIKTKPNQTKLDITKRYHIMSCHIKS